jgi:hypothetical protein
MFSIILALFLCDFLFYWWHRMLHLPRFYHLYKFHHKTHFHHLKWYHSFYLSWQEYIGTFIVLFLSGYPFMRDLTEWYIYIVILFTVNIYNHTFSKFHLIHHQYITFHYSFIFSDYLFQTVYKPRNQKQKVS